MMWATADLGTQVAKIILAVAVLLIFVCLGLLIMRGGFRSFSANWGKASVRFDGERVATAIDKIEREMSPNGGASLRDAVDKIETNVGALHSTVEALSKVMIDLHSANVQRLERLEQKVPVAVVMPATPATVASASTPGDRRTTDRRNPSPPSTEGTPTT